MWIEMGVEPYMVSILKKFDDFSHFFQSMNLKLVFEIVVDVCKFG